jgi:hypothetical protein
MNRGLKKAHGEYQDKMFDTACRKSKHGMPVSEWCYGKGGGATTSCVHPAMVHS